MQTNPSSDRPFFWHSDRGCGVGWTAPRPFFAVLTDKIMKKIKNILDNSGYFDNITIAILSLFSYNVFRQKFGKEVIL